MKLKLSLLSLIVIAACTSSMVIATVVQAPSHPPYSGKHHPKVGFERWAEKLGLSVAQKKELHEVMMVQRKKAHAIFQDKNLTMAERRTKMMAIRKQMRSKIMHILTPEQRKKLHAMFLKHRQEMQNKKNQQNRKP